jgi:hypothetical protein
MDAERLPTQLADLLPDWSGWIEFPETNLALPSIKFFIARSAVIPEFSSDAIAASVQTKINKLIIKDVKILILFLLYFL